MTREEYLASSKTLIDKVLAADEEKDEYMAEGARLDEVAEKLYADGEISAFEAIFGTDEP